MTDEVLEIPSQRSVSAGIMEPMEAPGQTPPAPAPTRKRAPGAGRPPKVERSAEEQLVLTRVHKREARQRRARELAVPGPEDVPEAVRQARRPRDRKGPAGRPRPPAPDLAAARNLREQILSLIAMTNQVYLAFSGCDCRQRVRPEGYPDRIGHYWDCPQARALDPDEAQSLTEALAVEVETHPEWLSQLERLRSWSPHVALAWVLTQIVIVRVMPPAPSTVGTAPQPAPEPMRGGDQPVAPTTEPGA